MGSCWSTGTATWSSPTGRPKRCSATSPVSSWRPRPTSWFRPRSGTCTAPTASLPPRARGPGRWAPGWTYATRRDGTTFPVEIALSPLELDGQEHVVAVVRDISDQLQAERRIREIEQTLDVSQEGCSSSTPTPCRSSTRTGAPPHRSAGRSIELIGVSALDINPNYDEREFRALLQPLIARQVASRTVVSTHRHHDGSALDVECVFQSPEVFHDGERRSVVAFARDITDRLEPERSCRTETGAVGARGPGTHRPGSPRHRHSAAVRRRHEPASRRRPGRIGDRGTGRVSSSTSSTRPFGTSARPSSVLTAHTLEQASLRRQIIEVVEKEEAVLGFAPEVRFNGAIESVDHATGPSTSSPCCGRPCPTSPATPGPRGRGAGRRRQRADVDRHRRRSRRRRPTLSPAGGTVNLRQRAEGPGGTPRSTRSSHAGTQVRLVGARRLTSGRSVDRLTTEIRAGGPAPDDVAVSGASCCARPLGRHRPPPPCGAPSRASSARDDT